MCVPFKSILDSTRISLAPAAQGIALHIAEPVESRGLGHVPDPTQHFWRAAGIITQTYPTLTKTAPTAFVLWSGLNSSTDTADTLYVKGQTRWNALEPLEPLNNVELNVAKTNSVFLLFVNFFCELCLHCLSFFFFFCCCILVLLSGLLLPLAPFVYNESSPKPQELPCVQCGGTEWRFGEHSFPEDDALTLPRPCGPSVSGAAVRL